MARGTFIFLLLVLIAWETVFRAQNLKILRSKVKSGRLTFGLAWPSVEGL